MTQVYVTTDNLHIVIGNLVTFKYDKVTNTTQLTLRNAGGITCPGDIATGIKKLIVSGACVYYQKSDRFEFRK